LRRPENNGVACGLMRRFNRDKWTTGRTDERLALIPASQEHTLEQADRKRRRVQVVREVCLITFCIFPQLVTSLPPR
jgi:type I restriction enzyme R subunit